MKKLEIKNYICKECKLEAAGTIKDGKCELCRKRTEPLGFWQKVKGMFGR